MGYSYTANPANGQYDPAFLYSGGVMQDLNSLIDPSSGWVLGQATGINDSGQVVGYSYNANGQDHAFLYSGGVMQDLGTLGGTAYDVSIASHQRQRAGRGEFQRRQCCQWTETRLPVQRRRDARPELAHRPLVGLGFGPGDWNQRSWANMWKRSV